MPIPPPAPDPPLASFSFTGAPDTYTVPGYSKLEFRLWIAGDTFAIRAILDVTPGEVLDLRVGGGPDGSGGGGWPGGGSGRIQSSGLSSYNTGANGLTDVQRSGVILVTAGGTGAGAGVTEDIVDLAGSGSRFIATALPGTGDPNRVPKPIPSGTTLEVGGLTGAVEDGADEVFQSPGRAAGAGGSGYGGGASGSIFTYTSGALSGLTEAQTGRSGTHFGPAGSVETYDGDDPRVFLNNGLIQVFVAEPESPGISVGSLVVATSHRTTF